MRTLAIAKRLTLGAAALALAFPGFAAAQVKCAVISSLLADDSEQLHGIAVTVSRKGYVDATKNGLPGVFRNADECDLDSPNDGFVLACVWRFTAEQRDQAQREFDRMRKRIDDCLPVPLEAQVLPDTTQEQLDRYASEYGTSFVEHVTGTQKLGRFQQTIDLKSGLEIETTITLHSDKRSGRLWMDAMLYRD